MRPIVSTSLVLAFTACSAPPTTPESSPAAATAPASVPAAAPASTTTAPPVTTADKDVPMNLYSLKTTSLDGSTADLAAYRGKVTLVVNVASECGYTPQYAGLQKLHTELKGRGFAVLGFPSNDFGAQEPGTPEQIRDFCATNYHVDFPMFAKVQTKAGAGQSPVYAMLDEATGKLPNWNFCKYLVGKDGKVISFHPSKTAPDDQALRSAIDAALK